MDIVRLRTLTGKSTMKFGSYAYCSVDQLIALDKKDYLRWVYFNIEGISFTTEILEILSLDKDNQITKPGKNPELFEEIKRKYREGFRDPVGNIIARKVRNKRLRAKYKSYNAARTRFSTKGYLQAKNQGK